MKYNLKEKKGIKKARKTKNEIIEIEEILKKLLRFLFENVFGNL
jgi:hypothetical protein